MASPPVYTVKSCGKAHAYCSVCRPDVAVNIAAAKGMPDARAVTAEQSRQRNSIAAVQTPKARAAAIATRRTPEARAANSERTLRYIEDYPGAVAAAQAKMVTTMRTPEFREAVSGRVHLHYEDPANRAVASANTRRYYDNDPATGGGRVPGGLRDAFMRAHRAYVETNGVCKGGHPQCLIWIAEEGLAPREEG